MEILRRLNDSIVKSITDVNDKGFDDVLSMSFNTCDLQDFSLNKPESNCTIWDSFWKRYSTNREPVVYWFDMETDEHRNREIFQTFINFSDSSRSVPAFRQNFDSWQTKTLYVGCCRSTRLVARFFWHTGYYKVGRTQGLQLCHWAKPLSIPLTLNFIFLPSDLGMLVTLYEKEIARHLCPMLGKHK